jgi:predicted transcriptional regulator
MGFVSIRLPEEFISDVKDFALKDYRTLPQQIMYWAELGKQQELRNWQLEKMRIGLQQAQNGVVASENDVSRVFNKCKK